MLMAAAVLTSGGGVQAQLAKRNIVWTTRSEDSAGSMPIGNGEVVLNVWVEDKIGDLMFLIGRTDSLSEISRILKLGRVRVHVADSPFTAAAFEQKLDLYDGSITVSAGKNSLRLFVDSEAG